MRAWAALSTVASEESQSRRRRRYIAVSGAAGLACAIQKVFGRRYDEGFWTIGTRDGGETEKNWGGGLARR